MKIIAYIETDFPTKFGIPRQSGLIEELCGRIVMEPEYRNPQCVKGLEEFSHIWLLWEFSEAKRDKWSATVKPPRLGGKVRKGVFATRAPYRPNNIGLSCVKLEKIEQTKSGPVLWVRGADLMNHTPIYDIKPYIPYADCHPEASEGFTAGTKALQLEVIFPEDLLHKLPIEKQEAAVKILEQDPRPAYDKSLRNDYGVEFAGWDIRFHVDENVLIVHEVINTF
ncbi:MAG: tRNA (N6-threonylcarbamoyladenosine(37)-N6)-methyltransferase TrmO [Lachnospiraceae bacterium]|nr:tRNA (N6-threonylcarbamoyladenosine(37)-N6)-methyltransferase TrmO [Lachnospiraceae bacterium]MDD3615773.1 tRNA (N6-threonylcarbamoyladenosine(37)-N6)-methyltransferase TrmO [Lachnospiraceae bacterium]